MASAPWVAQVQAVSIAAIVRGPCTGTICYLTLGRFRRIKNDPEDDLEDGRQRLRIPVIYPKDSVKV